MPRRSKTNIIWNAETVAAQLSISKAAAKELLRSGAIRARMYCNELVTTERCVMEYVNSVFDSNEPNEIFTLQTTQKPNLQHEQISQNIIHSIQLLRYENNRSNTRSTRTA